MEKKTTEEINKTSLMTLSVARRQIEEVKTYLNEAKCMKKLVLPHNNLINVDVGISLLSIAIQRLDVEIKHLRRVVDKEDEKERYRRLSEPHREMENGFRKDTEE